MVPAMKATVPAKEILNKNPGTVAKSQVSDLNGSRLCIVGVISPSSQDEQL